MKNQKGFARLLVLLVLLGVVVVGGGAYYFITQNAPSQTPLYQDVTTTPLSAQTTTSAPKATTNQPVQTSKVDPQLSVSPTSGAAPLGVSFSASKQGLIDANATYTVYFGDGTRSLTSEFTCGLQFCTQQHVYQVGGTYGVQYVNASGKTVKNFTIVVSVGTTNTGTVAMGNGVSFDVPSGWSAGPVKVGPGYYPGDTTSSYAVTLYSPSKVVAGGVNCPPVPKGGEGVGVATSTQRSMQKGGSAWTATYTELGGSDTGSPIVVDQFKSDFYSQSIGTECLLTLNTQGLAVPDVRAAAQAIYNSWK